MLNNLNSERIMETKQLLNVIKQLAREMANEKYQVERNDKAKTIIDFAEIIEEQANGVQASEATAILPHVSGSALPTDAEIEKHIDELDTPHEADTYSFDIGFERGAKWVRNKLI